MGSLVMEYVGEVMTREQAALREAWMAAQGGDVGCCYQLFTDTGHVLDPSLFGNVGRYMNGSCAPNLKPRRFNPPPARSNSGGGGGGIKDGGIKDGGIKDGGGGEGGSGGGENNDGEDGDDKGDSGNGTWSSRLPRICFFALRDIRCGEELTWHYRAGAGAEDGKDGSDGGGGQGGGGGSSNGSGKGESGKGESTADRRRRRAARRQVGAAGGDGGGGGSSSGGGDGGGNEGRRCLCGASNCIGFL